MIRPINPNDLPELKAIIDANELFPSVMLDEMTAAYFDQSNSPEFWLTDEDDGLTTIAYCAPERMTEGTYNLYLIAVHPDRQGQGRGTAMVQYLEKLLAEQGVRILFVETSGLDEFAATRRFYSKLGYEEEARIREFYQAGEDKIIFRKALSI